jgi:hypothetical protein
MRATVLAFGIALASVLAACGSPAPSAPTVRHSTLGPFAFDAPSGWQLIPTGNPSHYQTIFGFLAAPPATASETCGPDYIPGLGGCDDSIAVPAGSVVVSFRGFVNGACYPNATSQLADDRAAGWTDAKVAGLVGAANRPALADAADTWTWQYAKPGADTCFLYEVRARFGPKSAGVAPLVDAMVGSLVISPTEE